jgi:tetratricopeptide (TPR) repeat protein
MELFQATPTWFGTDAAWTDTPDLDAMIRVLADEQRPSAVGGRDQEEGPPHGVQETRGDKAAVATVRFNDASACNERGVERRAHGDLQGALAEFDAALRLDPRMVVAYNNRGVARQELGELTEALADFNAALRLDPHYADAYSNRAAVRAEMNDAAGAEADCRRALELAPDSASLHARRGSLLHQQKNWLAARSEYDRALRLDAGLHWVYLMRGNTYYHTGDWQALCADYRKGFALSATRCAGLLVRHLRAALKSDAAAALSAAEQHVRHDPDNPIGHAHRGLLLQLLRRDAEAEEDLASCRARCEEAGPFLDLIVQHIHKQLAPRS